VFVPLMRQLARQGYHCLALDLPGFGLSDKRPGNYDTRNIARIVEQFMRAKRVQKADLIAHSWGSSVTLAFALQFPHKVRRIVINSGWVFDAQLVPVIRWAKLPVVGEMLYGLFYREMIGERLTHSVYDGRRFATIPVIKQVLKSYKRPGAMATALAVARGMNFQQMEKRYHTLRKPALLQWGRQDRVALPFYGRRLVAKLPNARLVFLDRCGHMPMLERPYAFIRNIASFLGPASQLQPAAMSSKRK
jgi:pimeloyl-ACP methyl ester carboxylesterase